MRARPRTPLAPSLSVLMILTASVAVSPKLAEAQEIPPDEAGAVAAYATGLPAATSSVGVVGYCWGGSTSFRLATEWAGLGGAVVYYGSSPATETLAGVQVPVLGLYGGNDARVNATIPDARAEMDRLGKSYEVNLYEGAGHGFLRQQDGQEGANLAAARAAWPRTVAFFREHLGG